MPNTVVGYITTITNVLLIIFDAGIGTRIAKTYMDGITNEEGYSGKKIRNLVKAVIVIDSIGVLINLMAKYYK